MHKSQKHDDFMHYSNLEKYSLSRIIHYIQDSDIYSLFGSVYLNNSSLSDDDDNFPLSMHGRLWYSVVYDAAVEQLNVRLVKVKELPREYRLSPILKNTCYLRIIVLCARLFLFITCYYFYLLALFLVFN